jgi:hypothetical protein
VTSVGGHPSFLALDRLAVAGHADPGTREHAERCATCLQYVDSIRRGREVPAGMIASRRTARRVWAGMAMAAMVAVSSAAVVIGTRRDPSEGADVDGYTTVKGHPAIALYVKRDERVFLWTSAQGVVPGDRLRLEIAPDGFSHVAVLAKPAGGQGSGRLEQLYAGSIDPRKPTLLPVAWRVDDRPGDETLVIVLSRAPLREESLAQTLQSSRQTKDVWVHRLELPKHAHGNAP